MKNYAVSLLVFLCCFPAARAQQKLLSMEEVVLQARTGLSPKKITGLQWINDQDAYSYVDSLQTLRRVSVLTKENPDPLTLNSLNVGLRNLKQDTLSHFPAYSWESGLKFTFLSGNSLNRYDFATGTLTLLSERQFPEGAENKDECIPTRNVAYTLDNNLFMLIGGKSKTVTNDSDKNIVNGKSVHREEFGIVKGTFWSPKGNFLAFYRMDETPVSDYPILDFSQRPSSIKMIKYPMAGDQSHHVTVGIYDVKTGRTVFLKTGLPAEQYLANIAWGPEEERIYLSVINRGQDTLKFNAYLTATGAFEKTLFTETDSRYVHPTHSMEFVPGQPEKFIWQSRRDGYNHLYLYSTSGALIRQLTQGNWEVTAFNGFDDKGQTAWFTCTAIRPLDRDLYSVSLATGTMTRLTPGKGIHSCMISSSGRFFIDQFSNGTTPRNISVYRTGGGIIRELMHAPNPLKDYAIGQIRLTALGGDDEEDLFCRMILPADFDSLKKYPVICYVYGGPNIQLITNTWLAGSDLWMHYMAQRGFVVFTLDNRGTANRGKEFEQAVFRNFGAVELEDQLKGVEYLKSFSFIDTSRMGIYGWSYGGFMTTSMMTRHPGLFKAGVAGGAVVDWRFYEVMYTERYMDTPQDNQEGYETSNLMNYADRLKGSLLLIHGSSDPVVVWQHSMLFLKKCVDKGIPVDYFVYPGHEHNVHGKDRIHLLNKVSDYFLSHL